METSFTALDYNLAHLGYIFFHTVLLPIDILFILYTITASILVVGNQAGLLEDLPTYIWRGRQHDL